MEQATQKREQVEHESSEEEIDHEKVNAGLANAAELKEDIEALLDEIDEVLEANAEEFVRSFVQKGGQ